MPFNIFSLLKKAANIGRKVFLVIVVYVVIIGLFVYFSSLNRSTQTINKSSIQRNRQQIYLLINDQKLAQKKEGRVIISIYKTISCGLIGEGCTNNPDDGDKNYKNSLIGFTTKFITLPYSQPPASGLYWAYSSLQNTGFIPKTYAAEGIGFASIKGFMKIWTLFRDVSYIVIVVVIIAIGFMIMFRMKINPQTIISVENALPRIVVALLLITFSFPIAGFLIDMMYVLIALVIATFSQLNIGDLTTANMLNLQNKYFGSTMGDLWPYGSGASVFRVGQSLLSTLPDIIETPLKTVVSGIVTLFLVNLISKDTYKAIIGSFKDVLVGIGTLNVGIGFLPDLVTVAINIILFLLLSPFIPPIILGIAMLLTLLFLMFRLFFLLLTSYIKIVIFIIFAPIILLGEAIPGKGAFGFWIKNLLAELLSFPIVISLTLVGYAIINITGDNQAFVLPFLNGSSSSDFGAIIGLGLIMMTPDFIKMVKSLLGIKELPISFGIGTFFGGVSTTVGGGLSLLSQFGSLKLGMGALGRGEGFLGLKKPNPERVSGTGTPRGNIPEDSKT